MLPPKDVAPSTLWRRLQETPWPSEVVDYPRNGFDGKIRIRVMSLEEADEAHLKAFEKLKRRLESADMNVSVIQEGVYADACAKEVLALVCHEPDPIDPNAAIPTYPRVFTDGDMVGKLPPDEVMGLFTAYQLVQQKFSPSPREIRTDDELNQWIKVLAEGASLYPLARVHLLRLVELATLLGRRVYALSAILESQLESLPTTLRSDLEKFSIGTGFFGVQPSSESSSTTSIFDPSDESIDMADALEIAKRLNP